MANHPHYRNCISKFRQEVASDLQKLEEEVRVCVVALALAYHALSDYAKRIAENHVYNNAIELPRRRCYRPIILISCICREYTRIRAEAGDICEDILEFHCLRGQCGYFKAYRAMLISLEQDMYLR